MAKVARRDEARRLGAHRLAGSLSHELGLAHLADDRLPEAIDALTGSRDDFARAGRPDLAVPPNVMLALAYHVLGQHEEVIRAGRAALDVLLPNTTYEPRQIADVGAVLGVALLRAGHVDEALVAFTHGRDACVRLGLRELAAHCEHGRGSAMIQSEQPSRAVESLTVARDTYAALNREELAALCDHQVGAALVELDRLDEAEQAISRARGVYARRELATAVAFADVQLGVVQRARGRHEEAMVTHRAVREILAALDSDSGVADAEFQLGVDLCRAGQLEAAEVLMVELQRRYTRLGSELHVASCAVWLGVIRSEQARWDEALRLFEEARDAYAQLGVQGRVARCELNLGLTCRDAQRPAVAETHLRAAHAICDELDLGSLRATTEDALGEILTTLGRTEEAVAMLRSARGRYLELGNQADADDCAARLATLS